MSEAFAGTMVRAIATVFFVLVVSSLVPESTSFGIHDLTLALLFG